MHMFLSYLRTPSHSPRSYRIRNHPLQVKHHTAVSSYWIARFGTMSAPSPIPVLLCGKHPGHIKATSQIVEPECTVIKVCSDRDTAHSAVSALLSTTPKEDDQIAELDGEKLPKPKVVVMGGGFSNEEFESIYDRVEGAKTVPWIRARIAKPGAASVPPSAPPAEVVAQWLRSAIDEHLQDIKEGKGAGEIWYM